MKDIDGSTLIDDKTKKLLHLSDTITRNAHKVHKGTIEELRGHELTDEEIFEAIAVTALFNFMDRMADALGTPVDNFQDMMEQMAKE